MDEFQAFHLTEKGPDKFWGIKARGDVFCMYGYIRMCGCTILCIAVGGAGCLRANLLLFSLSICWAAFKVSRRD